MCQTPLKLWLLLGKNGPTGAVVRASPSYDDSEANLNIRTDRQTHRTMYWVRLTLWLKRWVKGWVNKSTLIFELIFTHPLSTTKKGWEKVSVNKSALIFERTYKILKKRLKRVKRVRQQVNTDFRTHISNFEKKVKKGERVKRVKGKRVSQWSKKWLKKVKGWVNKSTLIF